MPNIPKPDLERGNFICYADKPGVVVGEGDGDYIAYANEPGTIAGGGGGGGGYLTITIPFFEAEAPVIQPKFNYVG